MRVKNSMKNIKMGIIAQVVLIFMGFISRKIFIDGLGEEYLGINGLLTSVLSAMVLIEGGIGASITYNLYKPLAEKNEELITALLQLFKKAYKILGALLLVFSVIVYPFIRGQIGRNIPTIEVLVVYFLFVFRSLISYLFAYKMAIINADQKGYVLVKNNLIFQVITMSFKIIIILTTKSYILYLLVDFMTFAVQNLVASNIVGKMYPFIKTKEKFKITKDVKENITTNVKAMFVQNIGSYMIFSTDNILISSLISNVTVGLYSNYTMIMGQLSALLAPIVGGISNSVGNLIATEDTKKVYSVFKVSFFVSFWIYSFSTIFLYNLVEPFISFWIGEKYLLDSFVFNILIFNFYVSGLRTTVTTFKVKAGLFKQDKYAGLIEGIINIVLSLVFAQYIGLAGIFLGTTFSYLLFSFWNQPRILFKYYMKENLFKYFSLYFKFTIITVIVGGATSIICSNLISGYTFLSLVIRGLVCVILVNLVYLCLFKKTEEFKYVYNILINYIPWISKE